MERIETDNATHSLTQRLDEPARASGERRGVALCGRTMWGLTGVTSPGYITCNNCLRAMRRQGYQV